jgi:hypothetical protein
MEYSMVYVNSSRQILRTLSENRSTPTTADSIAVDVHGSIITPVRGMLDNINRVNQFASKDSNTKATKEVTNLLNVLQGVVHYGVKAEDVSADSNTEAKEKIARFRNEVKGVPAHTKGENISTEERDETTSSLRL